MKINSANRNGDMNKCGVPDEKVIAIYFNGETYRKANWKCTWMGFMGRKKQFLKQKRIMENLTEIDMETNF